MKQRLFVCRGFDCTDCKCLGCILEKPQPSYGGRYICFDPIRHRHPLEVALVREIVRLRSKPRFRFNCRDIAIKALWRVLKEGRKDGE